MPFQPSYAAVQKENQILSAPQCFSAPEKENNVYLCAMTGSVCVTFIYMNRLKILLMQSAMLLSAALSAREIPVEEARRTAEDFFASSVPVKGAAVDLKLVWDGSEAATKSSSTPALYVFDNTAGPGFVVVSGEDSARPILGYSFDTDFSATDMPENLQGWLEGMSSDILAARSAGTKGVTSEAEVGEVVVQHETALWGQDAPYNDQCPVYGGRTSVTGCGPTAMAIVMRYRRWPDAGTGTTPSYVTESLGMTVPARTLGNAYDWDNMPLTDGSASSWTSAQKNAVAALMADIGAAAQADYSPDETGIYNNSVVPALAAFMKYDKSAVMAIRSYYTDEEWYSMMHDELAGGPVMYTGQAAAAGHMFVLDGYTDKEYYHVNWGWNGISNGYFSLSAMNPYEQGIGSYEGGYNAGQSAVVGLKKDEGGAASSQIVFYATVYQGCILDGLHVTQSDPVTGLPVQMNLGGFWNVGAETYDGEFRLCVFNVKDELVRVVWNEPMKELPPYSYAWWEGCPIDVGNVVAGDYLMAQFYDEVTGRWEKVRASSEYGGVDCITLVDSQTIEESTTFGYSNETGMIRLTVKSGVTPVLYDPAGAEVQDGMIMDGNEILIDTSRMEPGRYRLVLKKTLEVRELYFVI